MKRFVSENIIGSGLESILGTHLQYCATYSLNDDRIDTSGWRVVNPLAEYQQKLD